MDIQAEKLKLIQWLAGLKDPEIIKEFVLLKKSRELDWWDQLDPEERAEIEEGLAQADRGEVIPHGTVMEKYRDYYA